MAFVYDCFSVNVLLQACKNHFLSHKQTALSCALWKHAKEKKVTQRNKTSMVSEANRTGGKLRQRRRKEQGWPSIANNCQAVVSSAKKCQEVPASLPSQPASPSVLPSAASAGFQLGFQLGFQCVHGSPTQHANCLCFIKASTPTLGGSRRLKKLRT